MNKSIKLSLTTFALCVIATSSAFAQAFQIAAGTTHTCVVLLNGGVRCWGYNSDGQLGDGTTISRAAPVPVMGLPEKATQVTAGDGHTCALLASGKVMCWGYNAFGQLGNNTMTAQSSPVAVQGLTNATSIAAGSFHTCAVLADHTARCWGNNLDGQLGNLSHSDSAVPVTVANLNTITEIAPGDSHTCARMSNGTIQCWGYNADGELGDGTTIDRVNAAAVSSISTSQSLTAGSYANCTLVTGGTVRCWGLNNIGQLGNGLLPDSSTPTTVAGITTATRLTTKYHHSCALLSDGSLRSWGSNATGEAGDGTFGGNKRTPVTVSGVTGAVGIAVGYGHTCVLQNTGAVRCWGYNADGELGNNQIENSSSAVMVVGLPLSVPPAPASDAKSLQLLAVLLMMTAIYSVRRRRSATQG